MGEPNKIISISVPQNIHDWLESDEGKECVPNKSGLFQDAVIRKKEKKIGKVSPLIFFVSIMGLVFAIVLIGIGVTPSPIYQSVRMALPLLGGILAVGTALLYYKERNRIKEHE